MTAFAGLRCPRTPAIRDGGTSRPSETRANTSDHRQADRQGQSSTGARHAIVFPALFRRDLSGNCRDTKDIPTPANASRILAVSPSPFGLWRTPRMALRISSSGARRRSGRRPPSRQRPPDAPACWSARPAARIDSRCGAPILLWVSSVRSLSCLSTTASGSLVAAMKTCLSSS